MAKKLFLIDASSSIYRAFFALPALSNTSGVPTNATLGFVTMLQKILREHSPDYVVVVWDSREVERRKKIYPQYKANRDAMPEDLVTQLVYIRRAVEAYGLCSIEYEGEEADDVIASLVKQAEPRGAEISIVSTDRDLMQLVSPHVVMLDTMRERCYGPEEVLERFGVPPERMLDYRSLVGDSSDNIPGVRGIGEKGAARLIQEYETLDNLLEHADAVGAKRPREALLAGAESARLSRELSRLRDDLPLEFDLEASALREPDTNALIELFEELELKRLLEDLGGPRGRGREAAAPGVETRLVQDARCLRDVLRRLDDTQRAGLATLIEPEDAMQGELVGITVSVSPGEADFLVAAELGTEALLHGLRPILEDERRVWVGQDLKRDHVALARHGIRLRGELRDAAVAAYVVDPSPQVRRPENLARTYLSRDLAPPEDLFGKGAKRRPAQAIPRPALAEFSGARVAMALELEPELEARLASTGQLDLYREIEVPLVGVLAQMELAGVRIDEGKLSKLSADLDRELGGLERSIYELAGVEFKINSPKQLQHVLFEKLALPPTKKTKTGFSTDESVLEDLSVDHELPREILRYRSLSKLKNTYVDALPRLVHPETGRIHCNFNQTVAATGRLSASNPNLQNIPVRTPLGQEIREAFIPAEGRLLLSADYSQIELRLLAHLSRDAPLLEAFHEGVDIHVRTASQVFGIPAEEVSDEQRARMKGINFGIIYGSSPFGIARQLGISQAEAQEHIRAYFERYPGVRSFLDRAVREAREKGYAETLDGRRRYLPDLQSRNRAQRNAAERMATNSVLQGTAADIIKRAMVRLDCVLTAPGAPEARMILTVHDELLFELAPAHRMALIALVEDEMQGVMQLSVPLEVNVGWGQNWREAH
jgi:DNA polymerase-1